MKKLINLLTNILTKILLFFTPKRFHRFVNNETVGFLLFGGLTTVLSIVLFALAHYTLAFGVAIAGILSDVLAIIFAFITNKIYVFESSSWQPKTLIPELTKFGAARAFTVVLGILALVLLVDIWGFNAMLMRIITIIIIHMLGNYALSKWLVFTKPKTNTPESTGG